MYHSDELDGMLADGIPVIGYVLSDCEECDGEQWFAIETQCCIECGTQSDIYEN